MHSAASLPSLSPSAAPCEAGSAAPAPAQTNADADRVVLEYLRQNGFTAIEQALHQKLTCANQAHLWPTELPLDDAQVDVDLCNVVFLLRYANELAEANLRLLHDANAELRDWVDDILDIYMPHPEPPGELPTVPPPAPAEKALYKSKQDTRTCAS